MIPKLYSRKPQAFVTNLFRSPLCHSQPKSGLKFSCFISLFSAYPSLTGDFGDVNTNVKAVSRGNNISHSTLSKISLHF